MRFGTIIVILSILVFGYIKIKGYIKERIEYAEDRDKIEKLKFEIDSISAVYQDSIFSLRKSIDSVYRSISEQVKTRDSVVLKYVSNLPNSDDEILTELKRLSNADRHREAIK